MDKKRILSPKERTALKKEFGDRVREYRKKADLSQEALAFECGLYRTYIGILERGEANVGLENIAILAIALRCKIADLFPCLNGLRIKTKK